jgi:hypothetical protein
MNARSLPALLVVAACAGPPAAPDAQPPVDAAAGDAGPGCPAAGPSGPGRHRLFLQGHGGAPDAEGVYPMLHDHALCDDAVFVEDTSGDGRWQPGEEPRPLGPDGLVHGEHFLVGAGAFVEFAITLCDDIDGDVAFYVANFDVAGSRSMHQLFVASAAGETLIADAVDEEPGDSGYNPFVRLVTGVDPAVAIGDRLLLRTTNLNGYQFSVMVWQPPSEYESWILVDVP